MKALNEEQVLEALYNGVKPSKLYAPSIEYNEQAHKLGLELIPDLPIITGKWLLPEAYRDTNLVSYFEQFDLTQEEKDRVAQEIELFKECNASDLLKYLVYLGDVISEHNIVTGVGRGSSVSLFTLYLIRIHKVNSVKYGLSPMEFFKVIKNEDIK